MAKVLDVDQGEMPPKLKSKPLQFKRGSHRAFMKVNPILLCGEPAYETDTGKIKVGNGVSRFSQLPYIGDHRKPKDGKSAYEIWLEAGHTGTIDDFLESLIGEQGKSTYEIWLSLGHEGTVVDFINDIHGEKGDRGKSAYEVWLDDGHEGTITDFLESLKGKSAYQIWLDLGHTGTEEDFIRSLKGEKGDKGDRGSKGEKGDKGDTGKSAYQIWLDLGNEGTVEDFMRSLQWEGLYNSWKKEREAAGEPATIELWVMNMTMGSWERI